MNPVGARPRLGVVGAGQLARMMQQAAVSLGIDITTLAATPTDPAVLAGAGHIVGRADCSADLHALAEATDVVTFDHEVVDLDAARALEAAEHVLRPSADALSIVADKSELRRRLAEAGLPQPDYDIVEPDRPEALVDAVERRPRAILKPARGGYDGRGVFPVEGVAAAEAVAGPLLGAGQHIVVEPHLDLDDELAVIVARRPSGETVVYEPVTTVQKDGMCVEVDLPCRQPADLLDAARRLALDVAERLDVVGLLAVELFVVGGELSVNELAVRPHNSGHLTIDACITSQFENHLRAVLDLPLGDPSPVVPAATMVNVVGAETGVDPRTELTAGLAADVGAHVHLYDKEPRPGRKIGHVTICGDTVADTSRRAWAVAESLGSDIGGRP